MDDVMAAALAGLIAGIAVAMPLGAIGVLLVNEGMTGGWRPAAAGATGVALVDVGYSALAVAVGASLSTALADSEKVIHAAGAVLLVIIAVRGLAGVLPRSSVRAVRAGHTRRVAPDPPADPPAASLAKPPAASLANPPAASLANPPAASLANPPAASLAEPELAAPMSTPPWRVGARFVGLTALNPLTAVYFVALAAGLGDALDGWSRSVAFVLAVFVASLAWQLVLASFGAFAGARLPPSVRTVTGVAGYVVVLGYAVRLALT